MESHKLSIKLFADNDADLKHDVFVPVFQGWIRDQLLAEHLLIDVADYAHVPTGPGTVLVAHEANIHFDYGDGHSGVLYVRKQPVTDTASFRERLAPIFRAALQCAERLENEPTLGGITFSTNEIIFRINDRLLAPSNAATFADVKADLQAFADELIPGGVTLEYRPDELRLFEVRIKSSSNASVSDLLARLEPATAPAR